MIEVSYDYYANQLYGRLSEDEFKRQLHKAVAFVRQLTGGKADEVTDDDQLAPWVKNAICAVVEVYATAEQGEIVSESNDGASVTYNRTAAPGTIRSPYDAAVIHLGGTGLLYRGVYD